MTAAQRAHRPPPLKADVEDRHAVAHVPGATHLRPTLAEHAVLALAVHRMLTIEQLREMLTPHATGTSNWAARLNRLRRDDLVRALPSQGARRPKIWVATRAGLDAALGDPGRARRHEVRGNGALRTHTLAVNDVGLAFMRSARQRRDECDWLSWEHEVAHTHGSAHGPSRRLIADAVMTYSVVSADGTQARPLWRFIELDRATMPIHQLAAKARAYARYQQWVPTRPDAYGLAAGQPAWQARYPRWPALSIVIGAADPTRGHPATIERRINQLIELCAADPLTSTKTFPVLTCHLDALVHHGPWAHIWRRVDAPGFLVDLAGRAPDQSLPTAKPPPTPAATLANGLRPHRTRPTSTGRVQKTPTATPRSRAKTRIHPNGQRSGPTTYDRPEIAPT